MISESDDEETAAAFALATASQGNVQSTTLRAWGPDSVRRVTETMSQHRPVSGGRPGSIASSVPAVRAPAARGESRPGRSRPGRSARGGGGGGFVRSPH